MGWYLCVCTKKGRSKPGPESGESNIQVEAQEVEDSDQQSPFFLNNVIYTGRTLVNDKLVLILFRHDKNFDILKAIPLSFS